MKLNHLFIFIATATSFTLTGCQEYTFSDISTEKIETDDRALSIDPDDPNFPIQPEYPPQEPIANEPVNPDEPIVTEPVNPDEPIVTEPVNPDEPIANEPIELPPVTEVPIPPLPDPVEPEIPPAPPLEPPITENPEPLPPPPHEEFPPEEELPPHDRLFCNILIDQTGLYFGSTRKYVAITGLTECAYNHLHQIEGPCDDQARVTILQPSEIDGIYNEDLQDGRRGIAVIPQQEHSHFLCISFKRHRFVLGAGSKKIIFIGRER